MLLAGRSYTRGLGSFLSYVRRARTQELAVAYYAFASLGRETARLLIGASARAKRCATPGWHRPFRTSDPWPIGSGPRPGPTRPGRLLEGERRYMEARLPSCAGRDETGERDGLTAEADAV